MPFRVKDILIDVLQPQPCPQHTFILCHFQCTIVNTICHFGCTIQPTCHFYPTWITCGFHCSHLISYCPQGSIVCPGGSIQCPGGSIVCGGSLIDPGPLTPEAIRERLKAQLAAAQAAEEMAAEAMKPQTLEQVDLLEGKLKEALADLGRRREELKKKG
jgi:hypothetical protein